MKKALVYNIQRYSIHDGPGIRTTVFFKGCPLNCWWCHNPESQSRQKEMMFYQNRCLECHLCVNNCPSGAISFQTGKSVRDKDECRLCGKCISVCPVRALEMMGKEMTLAEIIKETEKDRIFYEESGGGITISGGEPLEQSEFIEELITQYNRLDIPVAVDTCGYVPWAKLAVIASKVDLFLYDLKLMKRERHKKYTGVENDLILENLTKLAAINNDIIVRVPIIPGINDDSLNIRQLGQFLNKLPIKEINLLPYHNTGIDKYSRLGLKYKLPDIATVPERKLASLAAILEEFAFKIKIGG